MCLRIALLPRLLWTPPPLAQQVQPGLLVLTWTSMNVDGYLHRLAQVGA